MATKYSQGYVGISYHKRPSLDIALHSTANSPQVGWEAGGEGRALEHAGGSGFTPLQSQVLSGGARSKTGTLGCC